MNIDFQNLLVAANQAMQIFRQHDEVLLTGRGEIYVNSFMIPKFKRITYRLRRLQN